VLIENIKNIQKISCYNSSLAISREGNMYLWGVGVFGEYVLPTLVTSIPNLIVGGDIGRSMGAAIDNTGMVWVWGENIKGELGVGDYSARVNPYPLVNLKGKEVQSLAIGHKFTIALGKP
jgi:alpha-tubulin suppressor-like RCC1 family protein